MKKLFLIMFMCLCSLLVFSGCQKKETFDDSMNITKYSRDSESGTRDGFFTAIGYKEAKSDDTKIPGFIKANDNANMISLVKNDMYGIGYISLASLEGSSLKALQYEGVEASEAAVVDGSYKLSRNFNYITKGESDCTKEEWLLIKGFIAFMNSKEGLAIVKSKDGILTQSIASAKSFDQILEENAELKAICAREDLTVEIKIGGSTSVEKIALSLSESFKKVCKPFVPVHNHTGSGAAYKGTQGSEKDGINGMHIGFLSRELSSSEPALENTSGLLCKDGIVVVVNRKNTLLNNVTKEQLKKIYSTEKIKWNEL